jgi:hypothetical protein
MYFLRKKVEVVMADEKHSANEIVFDLSPGQEQAISALAGKRKVRLSGQIRNGKLIVDHASFAEEGQAFPGANNVFVAVNAPFKTKASLAA